MHTTTMGRYNIPLNYIQWGQEDSFNASPVVELTINRKKHSLLLDTGASICFLDKHFVNANKYLSDRLVEVENPEFEAHTVGGISDIKHFIPKLTFKLGVNVYEEDFHIIDMGEDTIHFSGLIGFNFLMKHKINIDMEKLFLNIKK